ncbi:MAG: hypothetical protein WCH43_03840 [Verrucomicrobiota bacterium]
MDARAVDSELAWAVSMELTGTILHISDSGKSSVELTQLNVENLPGLSISECRDDRAPANLKIECPT